MFSVMNQEQIKSQRTKKSTFLKDQKLFERKLPFFLEIITLKLMYIYIEFNDKWLICFIFKNIFYETTIIKIS